VFFHGYSLWSTPRILLINNLKRITFYFDNEEEVKLLAKYFNVNFSVMGIDNSNFLLDILNILEDNNKEIVGYDLDGVICNNRKLSDIPYRKMDGEQRREYIKKKIKHYKTARLEQIPIEKKFYIVTGRTEKYKYFTVEWLRKHKIFPVELCINPYGNRAQDHIKHKVETIKRLGITKFYEDNTRIYKGIEKECKDTKIILIRRCIDEVK